MGLSLFYIQLSKVRGVRFVDIGGIVDHHCLKFVFIVYVQSYYELAKFL